MKSSLPVAVRVSKTRVLKLPNDGNGGGGDDDDDDDNDNDDDTWCMVQN